MYIKFLIVPPLHLLERCGSVCVCGGGIIDPYSFCPLGWPAWSWMKLLLKGELAQRINGDEDSMGSGNGVSSVVTCQKWSEPEDKYNFLLKKRVGVNSSKKSYLCGRIWPNNRKCFLVKLRLKEIMVRMAWWHWTEWFEGVKVFILHLKCFECKYCKNW